MEVNVTVAAAQAFDTLSEDSFIDITFTNTAAFTYAAGNVYYYVLLTDSTSGTAKTQEVIFMQTFATGGTIAADTSKTFTIENTENLVPTITGSNGRILYHAE